MTLPRLVQFTIEMRPWSLNEERNKPRFWRAEQVSVWRQYAKLMTLQNRAGDHFDLCEIAGQVTLAGQAKLLDAGNYYPAMKAAIDGLADGRLIDDDSPKHVRRVILEAPTRGPRDALHLVIREILEPASLDRNQEEPS